MNEYKMTKGMAHTQSVWHMKTKAGSLLHGGGLYVRSIRECRYYPHHYRMECSSTTSIYRAHQVLFFTDRMKAVFNDMFIIWLKGFMIGQNYLDLRPLA